MSKRKKPDDINEKNEEVVVSTESSNVQTKIAIASARFRANLITNQHTALAIVHDIAPLRLDLTSEFPGCPFGHVVELWIDGGKSIFFDVDVKKTQVHERMRHTLNVLYECGVFATSRMFNFALYHAASRGTTHQMELLLALPLPEIFLLGSLKKTGERIAIVPCITGGRWNQSIREDFTCRLINRADDDYLNFTFVNRGNTPPSISNVLKYAIIFPHPLIVAALLERMPQVNFDLVYKCNFYAEPMMLSLSNDTSPETTEIKEMLLTGEHLCSKYYGDVATTIGTILTDVFIPDLLAIVIAYSARLPLSSTKIVVV